MVRITSRKNVRILLLGDRGVGKTSLILSLVSEEFPDDVPAKAEEITIPADVTPEMVPTFIVDYSAVEQTDDQLLEEIRRAHVICLVYSVDDERTLMRITTHWLPLLRDAIPHSRCPIILVGNKEDLIEDTTVDAAQEIMEEYPEIESFVECSAKSLKNISEMFYYAQKAVLHPIAPIYISDKQDLTEECKKALTRIFRVCDLDNDGFLNDEELNEFQKRCFDLPLRKKAMEEVKEIIRRHITGGVSHNNCITLKGFLYLHCLFVQRGRSHTTWTVLRKFGYNDHLHLSKDYLFPQVKVPRGSSTELSHRGSEFFKKLFNKYDKDRDGALSRVELDEMFKICPPAWGGDIQNIVPTNAKEWITQQGFLCFWSLTTVSDLQKTFEYLAYFGYPINECENQLSAIQVTREKKLDLLKKQSTRNVYQCHVIGAKGVGKSTVCRRLIDHTFERIKEDTNGVPQKTINMVTVYGQEKYLIMKDIEVGNIMDPLEPSDLKCDVVCLVYDTVNPKSFEYVARIFLKYLDDGKIPVLFVCNKSDLTPEIRQDYLATPTAFCDAHHLAPPHRHTCTDVGTKEIYHKLATMAAFPHLTELSLLSSDSILWKAGLGIAFVAAIGLVVSKLMKHESSAAVGILN
ncbi:mitochondrial Rho GTPase isoform X2 [Halyomorpha halys]|uniref:mitochondrial Rho GTPase isoform X2 n=1 Tax=Halyomorpha halys TaxID=286706 RepID=UPI0006D510C3|nr:mitochondrial Rho GTPase isoform X2 [Halyomorpha halys]